MSDPISDIAGALDNPMDAPEFASTGDNGPELGRYEEADAFPPGCPIKVLGNQQDVTGKQTCYYLNYNGQLVGLEAGNRHGKLGLAALFGPTIGWIEANFPQWSKPKNEYDAAAKKWIQVEPPRIVGIDQAKAAQALVIECTRKGIFDPAGRMRGRGAHRLTNGKGLIVHFGDTLLVSELRVDGTIKGWRYIDTGLHERFVYTAAEPMARPWHDAVDDRAAEKLLALLQTWNWKRPLLDAIFALGGIALGPLGGALSWRPNIWITGGRGTGKSTLNGNDGLLHRIAGEGLFRTDNASAAGLRQALQNSTIPVLFDEIEAGADNRRVLEVVELARLASSGGKVTRGSAGHIAQEFTLRSCFWFSSINIPPLEPQDRSRLAILELQPFAEGAKPPAFDQFDFGKMGRQLLRRMIDGWHRMDATKAKFHDALQSIGHDNRACDQFGTLLAGADLALNDHDTHDGLPDDEAVNAWVALCRPQRMSEISETTPDHQACVNHVVTSIVQSRGSDEREQAAVWIGRVVAGAMDPLLTDVKDAGDKASKRLQQLGLKLVNAVYHPERQDGGKITPARWGSKAYEKDTPGFLAVANLHQGLARIFEGTNWQAGVWRQALARNPGAIEGVKVSFGPGQKINSVLVPLSAVLDEDELPNASRAIEAAAWLAATVKGDA